ncbi:MAG TPA: ABC transporter permease [Verrucomicrobiae bacterium]|nr:ABC transporter permease [Verrucomicrobiae bacterium]
MPLANWICTLPHKLRGLFRRRLADQELDEELRLHIESRTEANIASGMSPAAARRDAYLAMGGIEQVKEACREQRGFFFLDTMLQDLRFAVRSLVSRPSFAVIAILTLALGIGATSAVFSAVDRVLFRSLPYPEDDRLVSFGVKAPFEGIEFMLGPEYLVLRHEPGPFASMTSLTPSFGGDDCDITEQDPVRLSCALVEANFLSTFGIHPIVGRDFTREDDLRKAPRVALLSYGLWQSRFGGDPKIPGKMMSLNGNPVQIVGVLPASFEMPNLIAADLLMPQAIDEAGQDRTHPQLVLRAFARLKRSVTIAQATAALQPWFQDSLRFVPPQFRQEVSLRVRSLRDRQIADSRVGAWVLLGAVLAVLLLACSNVANLLLVRAVGRQRELAVRAALGATRGRLVRQTLTEALLLALLGGVLGCGLAYILLRVFISIAPQGIVRLQQASLDLRVLTFCVAVSLLCGILFGVAPALSKPAPESLVGRNARSTTRGFLRYALVTAQIAGSLVLLTGAGLLLRSLWKIQSVPIGLEAQHVVAAQISLAEHSYPDRAQQLAFYRELEERLNRVPGITLVALSDSLPPSGQSRATFYASIEVSGRAQTAEGTGGMVGFRMVTPNYFPALQIRIVHGRGFTEADRSPTEHPVIISEALAKKLFGNGEPLGRSLRFTAGGDTPGAWRTVVGIAADVKNNGLIATADPEFYIPWKNEPEVYPRRSYVTFVTSLAPAAVLPWARAEIAGLDANLPVEFSTMTERIGKLTQRPRFDAILLSLFAAIAVLLAALGLYGVVSFFVSQRTQEIGVRMALGATPLSISKMVLFNMARWTIAGVALGILGSWFCTRLLQSLLFQVRPHDPVLLIAAFLILVAVALLAAWFPARRAARVDPMITLRYE